MKIESRIGSSIFSFLCHFIFLTKMDGCFCEICALSYTENLQNWVIWWSFLFLNTKFKMSILQLQLSHTFQCWAHRCKQTVKYALWEHVVKLAPVHQCWNIFGISKFNDDKMYCITRCSLVSDISLSLHNM